MEGVGGKIEVIKENIVLGNLSDGRPVMDRNNSHIHGEIRGLLPEVLKKISIDNGEKFIAKGVDMGRIVGEKTCVETDENDEIIFAQRKGRLGLTRFVVDRKAEPSNFVTVAIKENENNLYLMTAYIGEMSELEPWDKRSNEKSVEFWNHHALIWGTEEIINGTQTDKCPW